MDTEHEFEVWQNGGSVAWVNCGDRARAVAEISHYAAVYSKDGPVEVFEVKRVPFDPARSEAQPSGYDGLRQALAEAIEFAEQDWQALTPEGDAMLDRWRAALTFTASLSDASPSSGDE